jgi:hypothetical protein
VVRALVTMTCHSCPPAHQPQLSNLGCCEPKEARQGSNCPLTFTPRSLSLCPTQPPCIFPTSLISISLFGDPATPISHGGCTVSPFVDVALAQCPPTQNTTKHHRIHTVSRASNPLTRPMCSRLHAHRAVVTAEAQ